MKQTKIEAGYCAQLLLHRIKLEVFVDKIATPLLLFVRRITTKLPQCMSPLCLLSPGKHKADILLSPGDIRFWG